ncbi:MAG: trehalose-phosphatase [Bryobacteraceae bacterium]
MQYILSQASRSLLTRLAQERTLCAFDFDGTLSPITDHPDRAGLRDRTRDLLARLAAIYPCVIISGRARADVLGKLGGVRVARVIGNHGAETESSIRRWRGAVERWKETLELELSSIPGVWVEDKGLSLAVHYRQSAPASRARRKILAATRDLRHVRVFGGKRVVNLTVEGAPHKGGALAAERRRLKCDWVLYLGDDENDEDAFALEGEVVPVRIGPARQSHARYYLRTQGEVDRLLERLIDLREAELNRRKQT